MSQTRVPIRLVCANPWLRSRPRRWTSSDRQKALLARSDVYLECSCLAIFFAVVRGGSMVRVCDEFVEFGCSLVRVI